MLLQLCAVLAPQILGSAPHTAFPAPSALNTRAETLGPAAQDRGGDRGKVTSREEFDRLLRDDKALAAGQTAIDNLLRANGGLIEVGALEDKALPLFAVLPGLRYDLLETKRTETVEGTDEWQVDNYLPRMIHSAPNGDAYAYSEYTGSTGEKEMDLYASFRRDIMTSETAWAETDGRLNPRGDARVASAARSLITRELVFGMMPHGLALGRTKLALLRVDESPRGKVGVYALRLDQPVDLLETELASDFLLYVDIENWTVLGGTYTGFGLARPRIVNYDIVQDIDIKIGDATKEAVRAVYAQRRTAELTNRGEQVDPAAIEAESASLKFPDAFRIPYLRVVHEHRARFEVLHQTEDVVFDAFPAAAVLPPWHTQRIWQPPYHADHWDPPAKDAEGSSEGEADSSTDD